MVYDKPMFTIQIFYQIAVSAHIEVVHVLAVYKVWMVLE